MLGMVHKLTPREEGRSRIDYDFDSMRGGFCLSFAEFDRQHSVPLLGDLVFGRLNDQGRLVALESLWEGGRVYTRTLIGREGARVGSFDVIGATLVTEWFRVYQQPEKLTIWFGTEAHLPLPDWTSQRLPELEATLYFSPPPMKAGRPFTGINSRVKYYFLAGIELDLSKTVGQYPFSLMRISCEDFK